MCIKRLKIEFYSYYGLCSDINNHMDGKVKYETNTRVLSSRYINIKGSIKAIKAKVIAFHCRYSMNGAYDLGFDIDDRLLPNPDYQNMFNNPQLLLCIKKMDLYLRAVRINHNNQQLSTYTHDHLIYGIHGLYIKLFNREIKDRMYGTVRSILSITNNKLGLEDILSKSDESDNIIFKDIELRNLFKVLKKANTISVEEQLNEIVGKLRY